MTADGVPACERVVNWFFLHSSINWLIYLCLFFLNRRRRRRELNVHRTIAIFFRFYGSVVAIGWRRNQSRIWLAVAGWRCVPYGRRVPIWRITTLLFFLTLKKTFFLGARRHRKTGRTFWVVGFFLSTFDKTGRPPNPNHQTEAKLHLNPS